MIRNPETIAGSLGACSLQHMDSQTRLSNVIDIRQARSYEAHSADRYLNIRAFMDHFSVSYATAKNWARGYYYRAGGKVPYPNGPMPHLKTPGGALRFKIGECEEWLRAASA